MKPGGDRGAGRLTSSHDSWELGERLCYNVVNRVASLLELMLAHAMHGVAKIWDGICKVALLAGW